MHTIMAGWGWLANRPLASTGIILAYVAVGLAAVKLWDMRDQAKNADQGTYVVVSEPLAKLISQLISAAELEDACQVFQPTLWVSYSDLRFLADQQAEWQFIHHHAFYHTN
jgi:hypothetical protein